MRNITLGLVAAAACITSACATPHAPRAADPDPGANESAMEARIASLETRVAQLESQVAADKVAAGAANAANHRQAAPPRPRPDPDTVYSVPIKGDPFVGPRYAPVTVVEAFEFACPFCNRARPTIEQLKAEYGNDLKVVYKSFVVHRHNAFPPAYAACAAHRQGKFKEMHDAIWTRGFENSRKLDAAHMETLAASIGLDVTKFRADAASQGCKDEVDEDMAQLRKIGVRGTPTFYINGRPLIGAQPIDRFRTLIDEELAKARKSAVPVDKYYDHIVKTGVRSLK